MHLRQVLAAARFAPVGLDASWIERRSICGLDVLYLVLTTTAHARWLLLEHAEQLSRILLLAAERLEHFDMIICLRFLRRLRLLVRPCAAVAALIRQPVEDGCRGHFLKELGILLVLTHLVTGLLDRSVLGGLIILETLAAAGQ